MEYSNLFVCLMGICTVFIGLICIIILVTVMSNIVRRTDRSMTKEAPGSAAAGGVPAGNAQVPAASRSGGEVTAPLVAAVSAVLAEEMGVDVSGIRIVSFKKV